MGKKVTWHAHGCIECHGRYTDACSEPDHDGQCEMCRWEGTNSARSRGFDYGQWDPRPCCMEATEASKEQLDKFSLRGYGPWYICPTCVRTHPHVHPRSRRSYECPDGICDRAEKHHHRQGELEDASNSSK